MMRQARRDVTLERDVMELKDAGIDAESNDLDRDLQLKALEKLEPIYFAYHAIQNMRKEDSENAQIFSIASLNNKPSFEHFRKLSEAQVRLFYSTTMCCINKRSGVTIKQLCEEIGISRTHFYRLLNSMPNEVHRTLKAIIVKGLTPLQIDALDKVAWENSDEEEGKAELVNSMNPWADAQFLGGKLE
jgi:AraC-like DNA-binding protein